MKNDISTKPYKCIICKSYHKGKRYISPSTKKIAPWSEKKYICPSCYSKLILKTVKKNKKIKPSCRTLLSAKKKFTKNLSNTKYTTIDIIRSHTRSLKDNERLTKNFMIDVCCRLTKEEINVVLNEMFKGNIKEK